MGQGHREQVVHFYLVWAMIRHNQPCFLCHHNHIWGKYFLVYIIGMVVRKKIEVKSC